MKRVIALISALLLAVSILGRGPSEPVGIGYVGDEPYYTIQMTAEERETYFTVLGKAGSIAVSRFDQVGISAITYYQVEGGGYIAWEGSKVRYVPADCSNKSNAFATLTSDSSAMSIEEAKAYVPQLAD